MMKYYIINFLIGGAIAVIVSVLLVLGMKIFIPEPQNPYEFPTPIVECVPGDKTCDQKVREEHGERERQFREYEAQRRERGGKVFVASNITGLFILLIGLAVFKSGIGTNIAAGLIVAGAFGIVYGYTLGWAGADDKLKFVVGVIVAAIVIASGIIVNRMRAKALASQATPTPPGA